ncbi:hypothetical protein [Fluviicola sp.]|uniref:hypothetical protein n=1 Tax=Fluviicola sp. TaxID=1917219 RepID=UPI00262F0568|nr:hypothetical protein [Fluviicola sp.]
MKKTILIASVLLNIVLAVLVIMPLVSKDSKDEIKKELRKHYLSSTANEVHIDAAIDNLKAFNKKYNYLRAYKISAMDMMEVMGIDTLTTQPRYTSCRAYLGLDTEGKFRMYLTPVENNVDLFFNPMDSVACPAKTSSYVLDLIAPCPNTCDYTSPLYTFIKPKPQP